jgi:replication factor A1
LRGLIIERNIVHEDDVIDHDIKSSIKDQAEINNGNGKGKTTDRTTPISHLSNTLMNDLLIEGKILSIAEPRTVNLKKGGIAQVADAIISDETGTIKLPLWNDQINSIYVDKGYTKEYHGEIILCISKNGTLTKH